MTLTAAQRRGLIALQDLMQVYPDGVTPADFGAHMYPDTAGHVNAAQGLAPHAARSQAAGSALARLRAHGWVTHTDRGKYRLHRLTPAGRAALGAE